jgi:hypothetical protein
MAFGVWIPKESEIAAVKYDKSLLSLSYVINGEIKQQ